MSMDGLPDGGKIIVAAPEVAAKLAEATPEHADRVYTGPLTDPTIAYVIDLDAAADALRESEAADFAADPADNQP